MGNPQNMQAGWLIKGISRQQGWHNPKSRSTGAAQSRQQGGLRLRNMVSKIVGFIYEALYERTRPFD
tara:strand:- start:14 stop:214 length:201 start_codon:yes stop_codon:yes gene_type:complete